MASKTHKMIRKFTVEITQEAETNWNSTVVGVLTDESLLSPYFRITKAVLKSDVAICCHNTDSPSGIDMVLVLPLGSEHTTTLIHSWLEVK